MWQPIDRTEFLGGRKLATLLPRSRGKVCDQSMLGSSWLGPEECLWQPGGHVGRDDRMKGQGDHDEA